MEASTSWVNAGYIPTMKTMTSALSDATQISVDFR